MSQVIVAAGFSLLLVSSFPLAGQEMRPAGSVKPSVEKSDAKAYLRAARAALERGDLDRAETLAAEAEKAPLRFASWIKSPWADTPAKVWRDIQNARTRRSAALMKKIKDQEKTEKSLPATNRNMVAANKNKSEEQTVFRQAPPARPPSAEPPLLEIARGPVLPLPASTNIAAFQDKFFGVQGKKQALQLLLEAAKAIVAGNTAHARDYTLQAKNLRPTSSWNQEDLIRLRSYLQKRDDARSNLPVEDKAPPPPTSSPARSTNEKLSDQRVDLRKAAEGTADVLEEAAVEDAKEDEFETQAEPQNKITPGLSRGWLVLIAVAALLLLGVALGRSRLGS